MSDPFLSFIVLGVSLLHACAYHVTCYMGGVHIESVDSICRDGADMPISLNKWNGLEFSNKDVLSLFRQTTCSTSASIHCNTINVRKIHSYSDSWKIVKMPIIHHHHLIILLQFKWFNMKLVLYCVRNRSNSFMKIIYTGGYMILNAQNLHTSSNSRLQVLVLDAIFLFAHVPNT